MADGSAPEQTTTQYLDGFGKPLRTIRENDGALLSQTFYDGMFRPVGSYNITSGLTTTVYEASPMPFVTTVTDAVQNTTITEQEASPEFYDMTKVTDANGHVSYAHPDAVGRTRKTQSGEGGETLYDFDALSRPSQITNPIGEPYLYEYNDMDKVMNKKVPGAGNQLMWYDERFRLAVSEDANGNSLVFQYDNIDRVMGTYLHTGLSGSLPPDGVVASTDLYNYIHSDTEVLANVYVTDKTWLAYSTERVFSENGNGIKTTYNEDIDDIGRVLRATQTYPEGTVTQFNTHSDAGLLLNFQRVVDGPEQANIYHYFDFDGLLRPVRNTMHFNGNVAVLSELSYNAQDLVASKLLGQGPQDFLQQVDYSYDAAGKLLRINDPGTSECNEEEEVCSLSTTFTMYEAEQPFPYCGNSLYGIFIDETNYYAVSPPVDLGSPSGAAGLEAALIAALDYHGYTGDVTVTSYYQGNDIVYEVTVSNTNAQSIILTGGECILAEFVLDECCETEQPTGPPPGGSDNPDLFQETITYNALDISRIEYDGHCTVGKIRNDFTYDKDHRVKAMNNAMFVPERVNNRFSTTYGYDPAGNILSLTRRGFVKPFPADPTIPIYGPIDILSYEYGNEHLLTVSDAAPDPLGQPKGFKPTSSAYGYDPNGNITFDDGKGLTITYNVLNLPQLITHREGGSIKFDYTFGAEKTRMEVHDPSTVDQETRLYLGGVEYVNGQLESYHHGDGRVFQDENGSEHHQYRIADHLGNTAVLFEDKDGDGTILTESGTSDPQLLEVLQRHY